MERSGRIREEITGVLFILVGLAILLSLISHSPWDPSFFTHTPVESKQLENLLGLFGSYLSDTLLQLMGYSVYIIPLIFGIYGVKRLLGKGIRHRPSVFLVMILVLMLSVSSVLSLSLERDSGGVVGFLLTKLTVRFLSEVGSYLLFIPLVLITLMYLIPISIVDLVRNVGRKTAEGARTLSTAMPGRKEAPQIEEQPVPEPVYKQEPLPLVYPEPAPQEPKVAGADYKLPEIRLLRDAPSSKVRISREELYEASRFLEQKLLDFSIEGKVTQVSPGPVVTMFEFEPAPGIKISKVISLSDDLAMAMRASSIRISPIPGKSTLGIEVPNKEREDVYLKEILSADAFKKSTSLLTLALGKDIFGNPVVADLTRMPHLLVAGATGSGKSVAINAMILSLLFRATPADVRMLLIDPKMLELSAYEDIPHLLMPVVTSPKKASEALRKMIMEMERRYRLLAETGSRNMEAYNKKLMKDRSSSPEGTLPYIVIFIDELSDLMLVAANEVEDSIARLAQMARAAGIHLILATQRPSVDVITGVIKANFPSRISFQVSSKIDSRIVLDTYGAEKLLGKGDMLFMSPGKKTMRVHGAYVSEDEIKKVVDFVKSQGRPDYTAFEEPLSEPEREVNIEERDELYQQAKELVISTGQASISYIQRRLKIGYNRAARIMEMLEEEGIVGPQTEAGKPREVLKRR
jgi:S-DNA-T family DNA segregation ATPase FtsK/SpoIIIE